MGEKTIGHEMTYVCVARGSNKRHWWEPGEGCPNHILTLYVEVTAGEDINAADFPVGTKLIVRNSYSIYVPKTE